MKRIYPWDLTLTDSEEKSSNIFIQEGEEDQGGDDKVHDEEVL